MKVAIVQNLANSMFPRIAPIRKMGIDARLFVGYTARAPDGSPLPDPTQDPYAIYGKHYDWVHYLDFSRRVGSFFYNRNVLADFDIIHSCCMAPIVNQFFLGRKKFIALANGSDLRSFSLQRGIKPALLRRAYRRADLVIYVNLDQGTLASIKKQNLLHKSRFLDYMIDLPKEAAPDHPADSGETFNLLYPSALRDEVKGTSIFLEAFTRLVHERPHCKLKLIDHGKDSQLIRSKISESGLNRFVEWHDYCDPAGLSRLYLGCDAAIGYFCYGGLGIPHFPQVLLEGCYFGKAVISSYDQAVVMDHYSNFPVLRAGSPGEIFEHLVALNDDRSYCRSVGRAAEDWFRKNCSQQKITRQLLDIYREWIPDAR